MVETDPRRQAIAMEAQIESLLVDITKKEVI